MIDQVQITVDLTMPDDSGGNYKNEYGFGRDIRRAARREMLRNWIFTDKAFILWERELV